MPSARYVGSTLFTSSREKPNVVCVRSFVPNEKNSASLAISSATSAARGNSIIVPTMYSTLVPFSLNTSSATRRTIAAWFAISFTVATKGIITSGSTFTPFFATSTAASKIARACISVISGYDAEPAAAMSEHGIELVQLLHSGQQRGQKLLEIANTLRAVIGISLYQLLLLLRVCM